MLQTLPCQRNPEQACKPECQTLDSLGEAVQRQDGHQCRSSFADGKRTVVKPTFPAPEVISKFLFAYCRETCIPTGVHMYVCVCKCWHGCCVYVWVRCKNMIAHVQASMGHVCSAKIVCVQVWTCIQVDAWLWACVCTVHACRCVWLGENMEVCVCA